jgi:hypothetical protein
MPYIQITYVYIYILYTYIHTYIYIIFWFRKQLEQLKQLRAFTRRQRWVNTDLFDSLSLSPCFFAFPFHHFSSVFAMCSCEDIGRLFSLSDGMLSNGMLKISWKASEATPSIYFTLFHTAFHFLHRFTIIYSTFSLFIIFPLVPAFDSRLKTSWARLLQQVIQPHPPRNQMFWEHVKVFVAPERMCCYSLTLSHEAFGRSHVLTII